MEIEQKQYKEDFRRFKTGLESHIEALQDYINVFTGDSDGCIMEEDFRGRIREMILRGVMGDMTSEKLNDELPFYRSSLKRLWKKINNKNRKNNNLCH